MELTRLRSFVVLAERLHFGETANLLNLSQPALSKQIQQLEREIGAPLFNRDSKGTSLTEIGKSFLAEAQEMVQRENTLYERGKRLAKGEAGDLSIGFGFSTLTLVPRVISRFRVLYPNVQIRLKDMSTSEQLTGLESREIHLGFLRLPVNLKLQQREILEDELVLALPESYARTGVKFDLADFKDAPFVVLDRNRSASLHDHVLRVCAAYNFHPRIVQQANEIPTILALVAAGLGIALVPESQFRVQVEGVCRQPLNNPVTRWRVGAVWREEKGQPLTLAFLKILADELE